MMGMTDGYGHHSGDPEYLTEQTQKLKKKLAGEWKKKKMEDEKQSKNKG